MGNVVTGAMQGATQPQQQPPPSGGPPPLPPQVQWFAGIDGQQAGPFQENALVQMIQEGKITRETLVWKQGMDNWKAAGDIPDLAGLFGAKPPPLPE